jgi:hypothetical protein
MKQSSRFVVGGLVVAAGVFTLLETPTHAFVPGNGNGNGPPTQDVNVVNAAANPIPVTGSVAITGTVAVAGTTNVQGSVAASQSGPWTVGLDPAHNQVSVASSPRFDYDPGFSGMNDGVTVELGPFDLSQVRTLRILARAVNGDVRFQLYTGDTYPGMILDDFTVDGESGNRYATFVYEAPPPSLRIHLTESGPGGANFQVQLVGR